MPYLNLSYAAPEALPVAELAVTLTGLTVDLLGKKESLTVVRIDRTPSDQWYVGGQALAPGQSGAVLEIRITEGTNTKVQKAAYLRAVFAALAAHFKALHPASYVSIHELPADAWGYGGETQEYRFIRGVSL
ncbi:tautomerase family protein [Zoogloea sp.]|jgi:4-oxalocrotonate tautomerase|uniref:tautomerase family protein n=1 Tax=Zoogloea sp. TaxID=49181 RepID=UPI001B62ED8B|nr:tautomerase family protein [Zoogloea sp.]MBK6653488.1 tautomerase family protein [Zoogloea sp.]MBP7443703.1 tautomerase family protein [Zoogloea sp.]